MGRLITGVQWGTVARRIDRTLPKRVIAGLRLENRNLHKFVDMVCTRFTENPYATCITITRYDFHEALKLTGGTVVDAPSGGGKE